MWRRFGSPGLTTSPSRTAALRGGGGFAKVGQTRASLRAGRGQKEATGNQKDLCMRL